MGEQEMMKNIEEEDMNRPFIKEELDRALRNVKEKSAPGRDNIEYKMLKKLGDRHRLELLKIYN